MGAPSADPVETCRRRARAALGTSPGSPGRRGCRLARRQPHASRTTPRDLHHRVRRADQRWGWRAPYPVSRAGRQRRCLSGGVGLSCRPSRRRRCCSSCRDPTVWRDRAQLCCLSGPPFTLLADSGGKETRRWWWDEPTALLGDPYVTPCVTITERKGVTVSSPSRSRKVTIRPPEMDSRSHFVFPSPRSRRGTTRPTPTS